jgi:predicted NAD/FAD-binding protein
MRIAVVGSGVSGLVCAHLLQGSHDVVLYEADERPGGHAHTHRLELADGEVEVDSGFIVYNEKTYPLFVGLLERLRVASQPSDMSFSVTDPSERLEWRGTSLSTVFAQRGNLARPAFIRMLVDIRRFNRLMEKVLEEFTPEDLTLAEVLESRSWTPGFRDWYLIPLGSSIWSADPSTFMQIPLLSASRAFGSEGPDPLEDGNRRVAKLCEEDPGSPRGRWLRPVRYPSKEDPAL